MEYLSLFSGAGGGDLGCQHLLGWRCMGYVEWEDYCVKVIDQRIKDGALDSAPIFFGDIKEFNERGYAKSYTGVVEAITAGFPCTPFSIAGRQKAKDDARNGWPETIRTIRLVRPKYCLLENVPGLLSRSHRYFETILKDLAESGYDVRWKVISAGEVGAPHKRDRLWIVADSNVTRLEGQKPKRKSRRQSGLSTKRRSVADSNKRLSHNEEEEVQPGRDATNSRRSRVADTNRRRKLQSKRGKQKERRRTGNRSQEEVADTSGEGLQESWVSRRVQEAQEEGASAATPGGSVLPGMWWQNDPAEGPAESRVGRMVNGMANRMDRTKALGNGQVSDVVAIAWHLLGPK